MLAWLSLAASIALSCAAQIAFKAALTALPERPSGDGGLFTSLIAIFSQAGILVGLGCYGLSVLLWFGALRTLPLSVAYPMVGIGLALTAVAGVVLFGESLTPSRALGVALIFVGAALLARSAP